MKSLFRNLGKYLMLTCLLCIPSRATIIMVYTKYKVKSSMEDMKSAVSLLRQNMKSSTQATGNVTDFFPNDKFGYLIEENSSVISKEFSIAPGASAYFWSDKPVIMEKGFVVHGGHVVFENVQPIKKANGGDIPKVELKTKPSFVRSSMNGQFLHLDYFLSKPGPVSLQVFGLRGEILGRWNWNGVASGTQDLQLDLNDFLKSSMIFVRWNSEDIHSVQRILIGERGNQ